MSILYLVFYLEVPDEGDLHGAVRPLDVRPQLHELLQVTEPNSTTVYDDVICIICRKGEFHSEVFFNPINTSNVLDAKVYFNPTNTNNVFNTKVFFNRRSCTPTNAGKC